MVAQNRAIHQTSRACLFFRPPGVYADRVPVDVDLKDALGRLALFADFDDADLAALLELGRVEEFSEGSRILDQGQPDVGLYVIVEGEASVVLDDAELAVLPRGSFFGEISCLLGEAVVADVIARSPLTALVIPPDEVEHLLLQQPRVTLRMLKTEARRLKSMDEARA